jgi:hypothetical protein
MVISELNQRRHDTSNLHARNRMRNVQRAPINQTRKSKTKHFSRCIRSSAPAPLH